MAGGSIGLEIEAARTSFRWHESELRELLVGPHGPVARDLVKRAIRVEAAAKMNASHSPPSIPGEGPAVRTGRLRGSITWRLGEDVLGPTPMSARPCEYAAYVEFGTQPHGGASHSCGRRSTRLASNERSTMKNFDESYTARPSSTVVPSRSRSPGTSELSVPPEDRSFVIGGETFVYRTSVRARALQAVER
jgi:hypothetical protein